ncbi:cbb3-type cytochrome oxidase subunit 3 [Hymenobacter luteus]|uniref:Cbb3-type cytochrome oxidase subunit 3 n=2 Tax=Hymenobacter TaxID=89966 RepID=A0A7W9WA52_9BACT|nr:MULTISPECIES: hypothetical protein [Hymenobacter]MBB4601404.1 cbb3-type cytochrome oxidase subunit 3 [Hymenobacter latericoloratus]MBB6058389.1 cbb3-type cytochrome oxidase subunit 3 [Hymenobacter luteus]
MEKKVLQSIAGIELYPLISLAIFFLFFLGLLVYVLLTSRQHLQAMSELPLAAAPEEATPDQTLEYHLNHDVLC